MKTDNLQYNSSNMDYSFVKDYLNFNEKCAWILVWLNLLARNYQKLTTEEKSFLDEYAVLNDYNHVKDEHITDIDEDWVVIAWTSQYVGCSDDVGSYFIPFELIEKQDLVLSYATRIVELNKIEDQAFIKRKQDEEYQAKLKKYQDLWRELWLN